LSFLIKRVDKITSKANHLVSVIIRRKPSFLIKKK